MTANGLQGYAGKSLRVNLSTGQISKETLNDDVLRKYLGGLGIGIYHLYKEVLPDISWSSPHNRLIFATGPLTGTTLGGSGGFTVITKGALTEGVVSAQANGFLGAFLKLCGFDSIIFEGAATELVYLHVYESGAELRSATHLAGKDTWETEKQIKTEIGKSGRTMSVQSIGLAGENLVRFACIVGDEGHVAAHGGIGAVMGAKKLKAIAVERGKSKVQIADIDTFSTLSKGLFKKTMLRDPGEHFKLGTLGSKAKAEGRVNIGYLPVKNYSSNIYEDGSNYYADYVRNSPHFKLSRTPCWGCRLDHCHSLEIVDGPYAGYKGEEPDYEMWAGFGSLIGNSDWVATAVISNELDRLGMDGNESAWLIAWVMECYENGLMDKGMTGGLEMKWGNTEAALSMLKMVAKREGFGNLLAEGVMRSAERLGGEAQNRAVYTKSGNTPRMHDHRCSWPMLIDTVTSDKGRDMDAVLAYNDESLFNAQNAATTVFKARGRHAVTDSLVLCKFNIIGMPRKELIEILNAATGWDIDENEINQVNLRITNLLRAFDVRHGRTRANDAPSARYASAPVDGPNQDKTIAPVWQQTLDVYYNLMGWDMKTGKPLPETLNKLDLDFVAHDLWGNK